MSRERCVMLLLCFIEVNVVFDDDFLLSIFWFSQRITDYREKMIRDTTVKVIIASDGFYVYANGRFDVFFPHRRDIRSYNNSNLKVWFTYRDDNGNPHAVIVRKVYWKKTDLKDFYLAQSDIVRDQVKGQLDGPPPQCVLNPYPPRTVLLSGLPVMENLKNIQIVEMNLLSVFEEVGTVQYMSLIPGTEYAFARVSSSFFFSFLLLIC